MVTKVNNTIFCVYIHIHTQRPCHTAYGILVPHPGIEPGTSAVKMLSPNHRTIKEFPYTLKLLRKWILKVLIIRKKTI